MLTDELRADTEKVIRDLRMGGYKKRLISAMDADAADMALVLAELKEKGLAEYARASELELAANKARDKITAPADELERLKGQMAEASEYLANCRDVDPDAPPMVQISAESDLYSAQKVVERYQVRVGEAGEALYQAQRAANEAQQKADEAYARGNECVRACEDPFTHPLAQETTAYAQRMRRGALVSVLIDGDKDHAEWNKGIGLLHALLITTGYGKTLEKAIREGYDLEKGDTGPVQFTPEGTPYTVHGGMTPAQYRNMPPLMPPAHGGMADAMAAPRSEAGMG